ncbi:MAG TPA: HAMP domain-containing sensor histidine kinase [Thermodesulfobacteriota bacterium]
MSGRPVSIEGRLAWRLTAIFTVAIVLAVAGFFWKVASTNDTLLDRALQDQASDIARHLAVHPDGTSVLDLPAPLAEAYGRRDGAFAYVVYDPRGRPVHASAGDAPALFESHHPLERDRTFFRIGPQAGRGDPMFGYVVEAQGGYRIAVAQGWFHDDVLADSLVEEFMEVGLLWMAPVVAIALWVGVMTIRTSLAPVVRLSEQAARIGPETLDARLPEGGLPREVRPLVSAVNHALSRLQAGLDRERRFMAEAAHELRTPLAVLTARIDSLDGPASDGLRRDAARLNRLAEQLLRAGRLDAGPLDVSQPVDLRQIAVEALGALAPLAIREGRALGLTGEPGPVWVRGNRPALLVAIENLLENALVHTPAPGGVEVEVSADGTVRVKDEGPGVPPADREAIFRRFVRGKDAKPGGAGLGLAIVMETARAHGGSVTVADRPGGGAVFEMRLPG